MGQSNAKSRKFLFLMAFVALHMPFLSTSESTFDKTTEYEVQEILGFDVYVNEELKKREADHDATLKELRKQIAHLKEKLPVDVLKRLSKVKIWVEYRLSQNGGAVYHPSKRWLQNNGYNPDKARSIEISNSKNFINWSKKIQPCMILHEISHAYHHQILGYDNEEIRKAFNQAKKQGLYDKVKYILGGEKRAYALQNDKEYFAELSEAFFGKNDFFPFVKSELEKHDPTGYTVLKKVWLK